MNTRAIVLIVLQTMFLARVVGQVIVTLVEPAWLPGPEHWFSGILPYEYLLPAQILLLMFMTVVTYDAMRQDGYWHVSTDRTRKILRVVAAFYCAAMAARYALTMLFVPELRWFGHTIPIFFHFVLAGYILTLSTPIIAATAVGARPGGRSRPGYVDSPGNCTEGRSASIVAGTSRVSGGPG